jgi:hypothetical protein
MTDVIVSTETLIGYPFAGSSPKNEGGPMLKSDIKPLELALRRFTSREGTARRISGVHLAILSKYAKLDWKPWTQDSPTEPLFPSDHSMDAAADASRTAYSIMHLTKDQLIKIHKEGAFEGFEETIADLEGAAKMLTAVVEMIEGARGRMIASACAYLKNECVRKPIVKIGRRRTPDGKPRRRRRYHH